MNMKKATILVLLLNKLTLSQIDTIALSFYPLQSGNYWEYSAVFLDWSFPPTYTYTYYSLEVLGDSILPNGKTYKILLNNNLSNTSDSSYIFERIDSVTANVYRYEPSFGYPESEFLIDSLKSLTGDSCSAHRDETGHDDNYITICESVYEDTLLGLNTYLKFFRNITFIPTYDYWLAREIGLCRISVTELSEYYCYLVYAEISGHTYGTHLKLDQQKIITSNYKLYQNYPNPFNPVTRIDYYIPRSQDIAISLFNVSGQKVIDLYAGRQAAGYHSLKFDGRDLSSGMYYYRLQSSDYVAVKKCILLK
jgi:hypothetical protein